jgi:hypothetical protein
MDEQNSLIAMNYENALKRAATQRNDSSSEENCILQVVVLSSNYVMQNL